MTAALWFCFALSGAAALALETLWIRSAALVMGQTAQTTATVLACYFAGLGLGAAWARQSARRPIQAYGRLEVAAGAGALWSLMVFRLLSSEPDGLATATLAYRVVAIAGAILPAALCFGATLPRIGQALIQSGAIGFRAALLYALNTLGGAVGLAITGFGLPAHIGVAASYGVAVAASIFAGSLALLTARQELPAQPVVARRRRGPPERARWRVVAAGAGALGLGLEVAWTRLFAQVLHNSVYSFTAIALVFLAALAAGAALSALLLRRLAPSTVAGGALLGAATATVAGVWLFAGSTDGLAYVGMRTDLGAYLAHIVALAALSAGPAALASGVVLPALWAAWGNEEGAARPLGDLSAANTLGAIVGAVAVGFVAIPTLGVRGTFLVAAIGYVILADVIAPSARRRPLGYAVLLGIVGFSPMRIPLVHLRTDAELLRATVEGPNGIVSVVELEGDRQLRLDNYYVLGGSAAARSERRLGLLPLLLHPAPRRAAFIGVATGITASAAPALGVDATTVIELVPEVADSARKYFGDWNGRLLERADVRLVLDDGRRYLSASREQFDVIVSDLFIPWHAGAGTLYSREMYEHVARRLAPDGLFCQWLPLYQLTREEFETITRTFLTVFPHASLWRADFYPNRPVVGLVAQLLPAPIDLDRASTRVEQMPEWARDPLFTSPSGLAMLHAGNLEPAASLFAQAPINSDDRPLIEFLAPRLTRVSAAGDKDWFTGPALADFYDQLAGYNADAPDPLFPDSAAMAAAHDAGRLLYRYAIAATRHDDVTASNLEAQVRRLVPDVIVAAESTDALPGLAAARRELDDLHTEQERVRQRLEEMEHRVGALTHSRQESP